MKRRLSVTNLSSDNNLVMLQLNATGAFNPNIGKLFFELKLVADNLFIYAEVNWENTENDSSFFILRRLSSYCADSPWRFPAKAVKLTNFAITGMLPW